MRHSRADLARAARVKAPSVSDSKEPISHGRERIHLEPFCGQVALCRESKLQMVARFRRYVRAAQ